jgi:hypothetical protein
MLHWPVEVQHVSSWVSSLVFIWPARTEVPVGCGVGSLSNKMGDNVVVLIGKHIFSRRFTERIRERWPSGFSRGSKGLKDVMVVN